MLATITAKASTSDQAWGYVVIAAALVEQKVNGQEKALLQKTISICDRATENAEDVI